MLIYISVSAFAQSNAKPVKLKPVPVDLSRFVLVEGGSFTMGSATGIEPHEKPEHPVSVRSFYSVKYDVTFDDYDRYCDSTKTSKPDDMKWGRGKRPVIIVSWLDAVGLLQLAKQTGPPASMLCDQWQGCDLDRYCQRLPPAYRG